MAGRNGFFLVGRKIAFHRAKDLRGGFNPNDNSTLDRRSALQPFNRNLGNWTPSRHERGSALGKCRRASFVQRFCLAIFRHLHARLLMRDCTTYAPTHCLGARHGLIRTLQSTRHSRAAHQGRQAGDQLDAPVMHGHGAERSPPATPCAGLQSRCLPPGH